MKTINDIKHLILVCIFIPIFTSCNNWLAVDMEDGMLEDKLYESNEGYMTVLNGVYARLNENYSTTLSMTILDVMAQYYNVRQIRIIFFMFMVIISLMIKYLRKQVQVFGLANMRKLPI